MTNVHRMVLLLVATSMATFAVFGGAVPGFSSTFSRASHLIVAAVIVVLGFVPAVWNLRRVAFGLAMSVVAFLIMRGAMSWLLGGNERTGVFFLNAALALSLTITFERASESHAD